MSDNQIAIGQVWSGSRMSSDGRILDDTYEFKVLFKSRSDDGDDLWMCSHVYGSCSAGLYTNVFYFNIDGTCAIDEDEYFKFNYIKSSDVYGAYLPVYWGESDGMGGAPVDDAGAIYFMAEFGNLDAEVCLRTSLSELVDELLEDGVSRSKCVRLRDAFMKEVARLDAEIIALETSAES